MNNRGKVWIIPDEGQIIQPLFERDVALGENHTKKIQEFSDMYQLGFQFKSDDYQEAPCKIAELGHMVVKSEDSSGLVIFYLPERITDRQLEWVYQNEMILSKYSVIGAYNLQKISDEVKWENFYGMDKIKKEINRKYLVGKSGLKNK